MRFFTLAFLLTLTSCSFGLKNNPASQEFTFKTDFSVFNQRYTVNRVSETVENPDGSKSTKTSEQWEKGFAIEVVNLKK